MPSVSIWRERTFRLFFGSTTSSSVAGSIAALVLPILAIETLNANETDVGLVRSAQLLPFLLLGIPLGFLVDKRPRRQLMLVSDLVRALLLGLAVCLVLRKVLDFPTLIALALALGGATVAYELSFLSATPDIVSASRLQEANRATEMAQSGAGALGPALAGALVGWWSVAGALLFSVASYTVSFALLVGNRWREHPSSSSGGDEGVWSSLTAGFRFIAHHELVRPLVVYLGAKNIFLQAFQTAILILLVQGLELAPAIVGAVLAVGAIGFLCGAAISPPLGAHAGIGSTLIASSVVSGVGMWTVAIPGPAAILPAVGSFLVGAGSGLFNIQNISLRQTVTPRETLGRTNAIVKLVSYTAMSLGAFLGGLLSQYISVGAVIWTCGGGILLSTVILFTRAVRKL